jgi:hypothetical protein
MLAQTTRRGGPGARLSFVDDFASWKMWKFAKLGVRWSAQSVKRGTLQGLKVGRDGMLYCEGAWLRPRCVARSAQ